MTAGRTVALGLLWAAQAAAQVSLGGTRSGYVFDEIRREIRPVIGDPGAAYLGAPAALEVEPRAAVFADGGTVAIVVTGEGDGAEAWRVSGLGGAVEARRLGPARAASMSADGAMGLLAGGDGVRLVTDLKGEPVVGPAVSLESFSGAVAAVAFRGEPACAIVAAEAGESTVLTGLCADAPGEPRIVRVLDGVRVSAMHYSGAHGGLWIADRAGARLVRVGAPVETGVIETMAEGIEDAVGLQGLPRHRMAVARRVAASLETIDAETGGTVSRVELPMEPESLGYLIPGRVLVLNRLRRDPLLVVDLDQDGASLFIPLPGGPR